MIRFQSPVNSSWVTDGHTDGSATDLGHWKKDKNPNQDVFSVAAGEVLWTGYMNDLGNGIVTKHPYNTTHDMWVGMGHFLNLPIVKKGDKIKQGQKIANMGKSGISRGEHVHVRMSLVPKGTPFSWTNFNKEPRLDPVDYLYEYPHQNVDGLPKLPKETVKEENKPSTSTSTSTGKPKSLVGTKFTFKGGTKIYNDNPTPTLYKKQPTQNYSATVLIDRGEWLKIRVKEFNPTDVWIYKKDSGLSGGTTSTPDKKPTPSKPKVERVTVSGKRYLYSSHTGSDIYGSGRQNLKSRNMEVLERRNGRIRVNAKPYFKTVNGKKVPVFDVDSFWVKL